MIIAICDDEEVQIELLTKLCLQWIHARNLICEIKTFTSAEAFLFYYEEHPTFQVLRITFLVFPWASACCFFSLLCNGLGLYNDSFFTI